MTNIKQPDLITHAIPSTCPCCGSTFNNAKHEVRGPYSGPYRYVCFQCWKKSFMFFPDKIKVSNGFYEPLETLINIEYQQSSGEVLDVAKAKTKLVSQTVQIHLTDRVTVDTQVRSIPLTKLSLDPTNARLRHLNGITNEKDIENFLIVQPEVKELCSEIRWAKGLREPLVVDSKHVVREGNERLVCLRQLSREAHDGKILELPDDHFDRPQCYVLPKGISEQDIAIYIAGIHVKGKTRWRAINQAAYLHELSTKYGMSYDDIRKAVGVAKKTVQTTFKSYEATKEYAKKHTDDKKWAQKYSYYYELFKNDKLRAWAIKGTNLQLFGELIYTEKIPKGADVRKLKTLIDDYEKFEKFLDANKTDAKNILDSIETRQAGSLRFLVKATAALKDFPRVELKTIAKEPDKWKIVETLHQELESFIQDVKSMRK